MWVGRQTDSQAGHRSTTSHPWKNSPNQTGISCFGVSAENTDLNLHPSILCKNKAFKYIMAPVGSQSQRNSMSWQLT